MPVGGLRTETARRHGRGKDRGMEAAYQDTANKSYAWFEEARTGVANVNNPATRFAYEVRVQAVGRVIVVDFVGKAEPVLRAVTPNSKRAARDVIACIEERSTMFSNQGKSKAINPERTPFLPYGYFAETT